MRAEGSDQGDLARQACHRPACWPAWPGSTRPPCSWSRSSCVLVALFAPGRRRRRAAAAAGRRAGRADGADLAGADPGQPRAPAADAGAAGRGGPSVAYARSSAVAIHAFLTIILIIAESGWHAPPTPPLAASPAAAASPSALAACGARAGRRRPGQGRRGRRLLPACSSSPSGSAATRVAVDQPGQARRRAARPGADPRPGRRRSPTPTWSLYLTGFQPAVDEAVEQQAADRAFDVAAVAPLLDRRRGRAGGERRRRRPARLARPDPAGHRRRRGWPSGSAEADPDARRGLPGPRRGAAAPT